MNTKEGKVMRIQLQYGEEIALELSDSEVTISGYGKLNSDELKVFIELLTSQLKELCTKQCGGKVCDCAHCPAVVDGVAEWMDVYKG